MSQNLINDGVYELKELKFISKMLKKNKEKTTFLDVGANIGLYSLVAANSGAKVISVEGLPKNVKILRENVELNNFSGKIIIYPYPVGEEQKICRYYNSKENKANGIVKCDKEIDETLNFIDQFEMKTLDSLLKEDIYFMKIDIEDHELQAFKGMQKYLKNYCLKHILLELYSYYAVEEYWQIFQQNHFELYFFDGDIGKKLEIKDWKDFRKTELRVNFYAKNMNPKCQ